MHEVIKKDGRTFIVRRHPFMRGFGSAFVWFIAIALILSSVLRAPWLLVPSILILGGMVWFKVKASKAK
jgi:hypothetical protein